MCQVGNVGFVIAVDYKSGYFSLQVQHGYSLDLASCLEIWPEFFNGSEKDILDLCFFLQRKKVHGRIEKVEFGDEVAEVWGTEHITQKKHNKNKK